MSETQKYLELPYTVVLRRDEDGDFVARVEELSGCSAHGKTPQEALANLDEAKALWIQDCLENGDSLPAPAQEEALPSGKWLQRVPRRLHRKLQKLSKKEGVSLNQFVTALLAEAVGERTVHQREEPACHPGVNATHSFAQYVLAGYRETRPAEFRCVEMAPAGIRISGAELLQGLKVFAAQLPNKCALGTKVAKDEKKKHNRFEIC